MLHGIALIVWYVNLKQALYGVGIYAVGLLQLLKYSGADFKARGLSETVWTICDEPHYCKAWQDSLIFLLLIS